MENFEFRMAATETLVILKNVPKENLEKIPKNFIQMLKNSSLKNYKPEFDFSKPFNELKLQSKTKAILVIICKKFWHVK